MTLSRSRWAAIGAAAAVTLGAGGISLVNAANPAGAVAYVPISPCRLEDTRPTTADANFGGRNTPVAANETFTLTAAGGPSGQCTGIPAGASGLTLNVTAVGPTAPTFLTIWPSDVTPRPLASSLNPVPGEPPTPNAVDVELSDTGQFNIYNLAGNVDVIVDVTGYYVDHNHDDRYYTEDEIDSSLVAVGFVDDGVAAEGTVGLAETDGVVEDPTGVYTLTLANDAAFDPAIHTVLVTPACAGFTASVAAGTGAAEGAIVVTIADATGTPASCDFSFTVTGPIVEATTTSSSSSTSSTSSTTTTTTP